MKLQLILIIITLGYGCKTPKEFDCIGLRDSSADLESFYWGPIDSIVSKVDTIYVYNSRMDTVLIETGIFSYLFFDYKIRAAVPDSVYCPLKSAIEIEKIGNTKDANAYHKIVFDYYHTKWKTSTQKFSDLNVVYAHRVNTSIMISYSLEKLGHLDSAINVLSPYLANAETHGSKIYRRFFELLIKKYGNSKVQFEIEKGFESILKNENHNSLIDKYVINVFGSKVGVANNDDELNNVSFQKFMEQNNIDDLFK